jgi:hypothetical protein
MRRGAAAPGVRDTGHTRQRRVAARPLRPTTAAPCWERPQSPARWRGGLSLRLGMPAPARSAPRRPACHGTACRGAPGHPPGTRGPGIAARARQWDGRGRAECPARASRASASLGGASRAARGPPGGAGEGAGGAGGAG